VPVTEIEIGRGKRGRRAYSFDDIAVVPSRRTRDPQDVSLAWQIDAYHFDIPVVAAPMDSVMSPETAIAFGRLGGMPVLDLEGLWTRYSDPTPLLAEIADLPAEEATRRMQEIYREEIQPELIVERIRQIRDAGVTVAGALTPQRTAQFAKYVLEAGVDMFVIRGTTVSAEHVSSRAEPLNLKRFIYELDVPVIVGGVASYTPALHLMRTGAAGVLVGFGGGAASTTRTTLGIHAPMASAVADVAAARRDYLDESGGRYVTSLPMGVWGAAATSSRPSPAAPMPSCSGPRSRAVTTRPGLVSIGGPRRTIRNCLGENAFRWARPGRWSEFCSAPARMRRAGPT
jgi:IMP dehydrogenase